MAGIKVEYSIDEDFFEIGAAYRLRLGTNIYSNALLKHVSKDEVVFMFLDTSEKTITIDELRFRNNYNIIKLKEDYEDGKFSLDD